MYRQVRRAGGQERFLGGGIIISAGLQVCKVTSQAKGTPGPAGKGHRKEEKGKSHVAGLAAVDKSQL